MNDKIEEIIEVINDSVSVLVLSHFEPDGDALGSAIAFSLFLREQVGKEVYFPAPANWPGRYSFLKKHYNGNNELPDREVDSIFFLDTLRHIY